jgi:hypothetical protein
MVVFRFSCLPPFFTSPGFIVSAIARVPNVWRAQYTLVNPEFRVSERPAQHVFQIDQFAMGIYPRERPSPRRGLPAEGP